MATNNSDKMKKPYPAVGKIYWRIPLTLETPVIIGSGESERSEVDVLREPVLRSLPPVAASWLKKSGKTPHIGGTPGRVPLLPATSLIGVFRAYLETQVEKAPDRTLQANFDYLFGGRQGKKQKTPRPPQSALQCEDVLLWNCQTKIRDGVAIDHTTNRAEDEKKFAYEIIEPGQSFDLNLEITLREELENDQDSEKKKERIKFDKDIFKQLICSIIAGIEQGHIRLGAKTNKGFGKLAVKSNSIQIAELDFRRKEDLYAWLSGELEHSYKEFKLDPKTLLTIPQQDFKIDAWFKIKSSLLIKSYEADPAQPDAIPLRSQKGYVMPGTSVMGAIRHRALKILRTLGMDQDEVEKRKNKLFGFVEEKNSGNPAGKGRVLVEETIIKNVIPAVQTRIKIDRFTGGTIHGALFEMMPLWQSGNGQAVNIALTVRDYDDKEIAWAPGLLLYVLKDLWTGDLPIGGEKNVGRGVLQGVSARITWADKTVELAADGEGRLIYNKEKFALLEPFAQTLAQEIKP